MHSPLCYLCQPSLGKCGQKSSRLRFSLKSNPTWTLHLRFGNKITLTGAAEIFKCLCTDRFGLCNSLQRICSRDVTTLVGQGSFSTNRGELLFKQVTFLTKSRSMFHTCWVNLECSTVSTLSFQCTVLVLNRVIHAPMTEYKWHSFMGGRYDFAVQEGQIRCTHRVIRTDYERPISHMSL